MGLNKLYGKNASEQFAATLPDRPKSINEIDIADGSVRVVVTWARSELKIDCWPERVHFSHLRSGRKGLYSDLCNALPGLFKLWGVSTFTASANATSAEILKKRGEWREDEMGLVWEL